MNDTNKTSNVHTLMVWDFENLHRAAYRRNHPPGTKYVARPTREFDALALGRRLNTDGKGVLSIMVADWSWLFQYSRDAILSRSRQVQVSPSTGGGQNSSDIQAVIETIQAVLDNPDIHQVYLLTGDSDFVPLVAWLQRRGISVHVWAYKLSTSETLRQLADIYVDLGNSLLAPGEKPMQQVVEDAAKDMTLKPAPAPAPVASKTFRSVVTVSEARRALGWLSGSPLPPITWLFNLLQRHKDTKGPDGYWGLLLGAELEEPMKPKPSRLAGESMAKFLRRTQLLVPEGASCHKVNPDIVNGDMHTLSNLLTRTLPAETRKEWGCFDE